MGMLNEGMEARKGGSRVEIDGDVRRRDGSKERRKEG